MQAMLQMPIRWIVLPLALIAAGCVALPDNASYLYGERYYLAKRNTYPTRVTAVDGWSTMPYQNPVRVEPGERLITLATPPAAGFRVSESREIQFTVEPCKYYYFVAERDNRLQQEWRPVIDYMEDRGGKGCN
jgi:hypothetical protein